MKPPFKPTPQLGRLESLTSVASTAISRLEADVAWYKAALSQKAVWERQQQQDLAEAKMTILRLWVCLCGLTTLLAICATALALRWH